MKKAEVKYPEAVHMCYKQQHFKKSGQTTGGQFNGHNIKYTMK
jgi:hypothetical protein